jgi:hypothetical protein
MTRFVRAFAVALVAFAAIAAQAGGPIAVCLDGTPMKLPEGGLLYVNPDNGNFGARTAAQMASIIDDASIMWLGVPSTAEVRRGPALAEKVTSSNHATYTSNFDDGLNPIIYDTDGSIIDSLMGAGASNGTLAIWAARGRPEGPCELQEGYMVLNGKMTMSDAQLRNVIAKQMGHLLGLDNTQLDGAQGLPTSNYPLMYPIAFREVWSLHPDDAATITALYPRTDADSMYGTLAGTFVMANGTPVLGANIWARNIQTSQVFSSVSDYLTRRTGEFRMRVPRGTYTLHAEAIKEGFKVGPWSSGPTDMSFQFPLYLSAGVPMPPVTMSPTVGVTEGCTASVTFSVSGSGTMGSTCNVPSQMVAPVPGSTLSSTAVPFVWDEGIGPITERYFSVGTTPGGSQIYAGYQGAGTGRSVFNLPSDGSTVYVRLLSFQNAEWRERNYTYKAVTGPAPSEMVNPASGSTLSGPTVTFNWSSGRFITSRELSIGSTPGGWDVLFPRNLGDALSLTVENLPTDGRKLYVTLVSRNGFTSYTYSAAYTYTAAVMSLPSEMIVPVQGSKFSSTTQFFQWGPGSGVTERYLSIGSTLGAGDIYSAYPGSATGRSVTNLPADGRTLYVRLSSYMSTGWTSFDYTYTASGTAAPAPCTPPAGSAINAPSPGATLSGSSATLGWTAGCNVTERYLAVGSTIGASDIYGGYQGAAAFKSLTGIPTDGRTIYVTLSSWVNGGWQASSATYVASGSGGGLPPTAPAASQFTSPQNGTVALGSTVLFQWNAGSGVTERYLTVGTTSGGSDIYGGYQGSALTRGVSGIPADGRNIYATLSSWIGSGWFTSSVTFSSSGGSPGPTAEPASVMTSPTPGTTTGYPAQTFTWTAGAGVTERYFMVGTTSGGSEIYAGYEGTALSRRIFNMPTGGITIYVRLMSYVGGSWVVKNYTYLAEP